MLNWAAFISGKDRLARHIIDQCQVGGKLHGKINPVLVIANRAKIEGVTRCRETGIPVEIVLSKDYKERKYAFGEAIIDLCEQYHVQYATQCGWLVETPPNVIDYFYQGTTYSRLFNGHNGPINHGMSDFGGQGMYGLRAHAAVLAFNRLATHPLVETMAVCHFVEHGEMDNGGIILQRPVPIERDDTPEILAARVFEVECQLHTDVLWFLSDGRLPRTSLGSNRIIHPDDFGVLQQARAEAIAMYP